MPQVLWALLLTVCLGIGVAAQQNPTLAEVLKQNAVSFSTASLSHLNSRITSFAILDDDREFLIAYYLDNPEN